MGHDRLRTALSLDVSLASPDGCSHHIYLWHRIISNGISVTSAIEADDLTSHDLISLSIPSDMERCLTRLEVT